jgi:hypothetical protein
MINKLKYMIGIGALLLLVLAAGLWFFLAYRAEKAEKSGEWVCENREWVKKGETDAPKPRVPCPDNKPHVKGPTAPPPGF